MAASLPLAADFAIWYCASVVCTASTKLLFREGVLPSARWLTLIQLASHSHMIHTLFWIMRPVYHLYYTLGVKYTDLVSLMARRDGLTPIQLASQSHFTAQNGVTMYSNKKNGVLATSGFEMCFNFAVNHTLEIKLAQHLDSR